MNYRFFVYFVFYTFLFPPSCFSYSNDIDSDQITNVLNACLKIIDNK